MTEYIYEFEIYTEKDREPWYVTHNSPKFDEELEEFINEFLFHVTGPDSPHWDCLELYNLLEEKSREKLGMKKVTRSFHV